MNIDKCPHCGGEALLHGNYSPKNRVWFIFCKCSLCGSQGKAFTEKQDPEAQSWDTMACNNAVSAWNMRYKGE